MNPSAIQHMTLATGALFTHDAQGRMLRVNEPDGDLAPRFFLGRTTEGNLWRFRHDLPENIVRALERWCRLEPIAGCDDDLRRPPLYFEAFRQALTTHAPVHDSYDGPEFCFPESNAFESKTAARRLTAADAEKLQPHFAWISRELHGLPPAWGVEQDGLIAAVCFSARTTPAADEAGVETVPEYRGRGYAPACVAAWGGAIRSLGRVPLYGTSWDNAASQGVARRLGLILFGAVLHMQ